MNTGDTLSALFSSFQNEVFGSILLLAVIMLGFIGILLIVSRINFRVGFLLIIPALLALTGPGFVQPFLGTAFMWIGVMLLMGVSLIYAVIWWKAGKG